MNSQASPVLFGLVIILVWVVPAGFGIYAALRLLLSRPLRDLGLLAVSVLIPALTGAGLVWLSAFHFRQYGYVLFIGLPLYCGVLPVVIYSCRQPCSYWDGMGLASLTLYILGASIFGSGLDGLICILMATPLALGMALTGAFVATLVVRSRYRRRGIVLMLLACSTLPLLIKGEAMCHGAAPTSTMVSVIDIAAPAETVWKFIPAIPPIPGPPEALFRAGIAYPLRSEMRGAGVGAQRLCILSTGPMTEIITAWKPNQLLRFAVTSVPPAMRETSPYPGLQTPHLENFMTPEWGEFRLIPLDRTHTKLVGTSRYHNPMWPSHYWLPISDYIVHRIHMRVMSFIKTEAEGDTERQIQESHFARAH